MSLNSITKLLEIKFSEISLNQDVSPNISHIFEFFDKIMDILDILKDKPNFLLKRDLLNILKDSMVFENSDLIKNEDVLQLVKANSSKILVMVEFVIETIIHYFDLPSEDTYAVYDNLKKLTDFLSIFGDIDERVYQLAQQLLKQLLKFLCNYKDFKNMYLLHLARKMIIECATKLRCVACVISELFNTLSNLLTILPNVDKLKEQYDFFVTLSNVLVVLKFTLCYKKIYMKTLYQNSPQLEEEAFLYSFLNNHLYLCKKNTVVRNIVKQIMILIQND